MLPLTAGFVIMGPLSGWLSDKYGSRLFATSGLLLTAITFLILSALPYNFEYPIFAVALFIMGLGNGMFGAPNIAAIMNSVSSDERGVASGMRAMLQNSGIVTFMAMFFTIVIVSLTRLFPHELTMSLANIGASNLIAPMSKIPPTGALFAAFLGYNPVNSILASVPQSLVVTISPGTLKILTSTTWFPTTLAQAFMPSLRLSFYIGAILSIIATVFSAMRGPAYMRESKGKPHEDTTEELDHNYESRFNSDIFGYPVSELNQSKKKYFRKQIF